MLINPEGSPFYIFRHYATFFERKKFSKISIFFQKFFLRFLSLRYGADFRRSRLVHNCFQISVKYGKSDIDYKDIKKTKK